MRSQDSWFGDPRTLLYTSKPLCRRVQWFLGHRFFLLPKRPPTMATWNASWAISERTKRWSGDGKIMEDYKIPPGRQVVTLPKFNIAPWKMMVGKLLSFWEGNFSGAMLNFRWVTVWWFEICLYVHPDPWGNDPISLVREYHDSSFNPTKIVSPLQLGWLRDQNHHLKWMGFPCWSLHSCGNSLQQWPPNCM